MVRAADLIVGESYFMVTYPDTSLCTPIVVTYKYLGQDPELVEEDKAGPHYYFRYLLHINPKTIKMMRMRRNGARYFRTASRDGARVHQLYTRKRSYRDLKLSTASLRN